MPEDSSISHKQDPEKHFGFECPACGMIEVTLRYSQGVADEIFVEVRCQTCGENGFFQFSCICTSKYLEKRIINY